MTDNVDQPVLVVGDCNLGYHAGVQPWPPRRKPKPTPEQIVRYMEEANKSDTIT